jgi:hypothetical protein
VPLEPTNLELNASMSIRFVRNFSYAKEIYRSANSRTFPGSFFNHSLLFRALIECIFSSSINETNVPLKFGPCRMMNELVAMNFSTRIRNDTK